MCRYDFLPTEVGWVTDNRDIWTEVEAVLFDEDHRARLLAAQRAFSERDKTATLSGEGDALAAALTEILSRPAAPSGGQA